MPDASPNALSTHTCHVAWLLKIVTAQLLINLMVLVNIGVGKSILITDASLTDWVKKRYFVIIVGAYMYKGG